MKDNRPGVRPRRGKHDCEVDGGWTFLETIVVISIILLLSGTVGIVAVGQLGRARVAVARAQLAGFALALESYALDCGTYPTEAQGLEALWSQPVMAPVPENWAGPYLMREVGLDPWGNRYEYRVPGPHGLPYEIRSLGSDGLPGGEGRAADILSWEA
ncbi:MAG: type II secretion system major pseudopilin GspG [bacterium]